MNNHFNPPPHFLQAAYSSHLTSPYSPHDDRSPDMKQYDHPLGMHHSISRDGGHSARESNLDNHHQQSRSMLGVPRSQQSQSQYLMNQSNISQRSSIQSHTSQADEQRKQEIMARLQQERELRRKILHESTTGQQEGSVQTAGFGGNPSLHHYQPSVSHQHFDQHQASHRDSQSSLSSHMNHASTHQLGGKDLVQKLLNERKINRGHNASTYSQQQYSNHQDEYSEGNHSQRKESMLLDIEMEQQHQNSARDGFGGFNPEALYQEEALQEYSHQDSQRDRQGYQVQHRGGDSRVNQNHLPVQEIDDKKYRDAVEYARAQIERDRQKRLSELHHVQMAKISSQTQLRSAAAAADFHQVSKDSSASGSRSNSRHHNGSLEQHYLPSNIQAVQRQVVQNTVEKHLQEMNSQSRKRVKHCFAQDSEDQRKTSGASRNRKEPAEERGFLKTTVKSLSSGDYMKTTVNADLKKQGEYQVPTIAKTKQIITDAEKKFNEEHTFKPNINDYAMPVSKELSKEERWKKLTEPKTSELQKRERIRAQIEIEETTKTCPFRPQIQPTSTKSGRSYTTARSVQQDLYTLPERLLHEADLRKEKREKLKREHEMEQMKDCSFKPKILSTSTYHSSSHSTLGVVNLEKLQGRDPIHQRVQELQKDKNEKLQKLRIKSEQDQQDSYTFQPHVNKRSNKMAIIKNTQQNEPSVVDRLYKDANERIEKQMSHNVSVNEQMNREYSFHPHISKSSAYMSAQSDMFNGNMKDFHDRQDAFVKRQHENKLEARKMWADEERYSFKPEINATSEVIVESDPTRGAETSQDRIQRLYSRDHRKQQVVREIIEKEVYSQYTFKPEINKVSKAIARNGATIDELSYNPKGRERKEILQEQLMTQEFSDCTFRPQTTKSKKYQNVTSSYSMGDCSSSEDYSRKLKEKLKEKQERIAQERREREYQQMKDCSFHPKILDKDPSTIMSENVSVKGLARHLELKELKKRQDEDKRLREAEVFGLDHKFAAKVDDLDISSLPQKKQIQQNQLHQTILQPFELTNAGNLNEMKRAQLSKNVKDKEMTECTFKPKTNIEGRNKKLINDLVSQIDDMGQRRSHQYLETGGGGGQRQASNDDKENYHLYYNLPQQMMTETSGY